MSNGTPVEIQFQLRPKLETTQAEMPRATSGQFPQVTRILALAIHFDDMIRRGDAKDYADVARLTCLCRERVSQVMRLTYLSPDIQIEILYLPPTPRGRFPISETAVRKIANLLSWADQRREWARLKQVHRLA